jgi:beta-glucosidase
MHKKFPSDFIFGVADADLQVIGEDNTLKEEQSEKTMWYNFAERAQKDTPAVGIDRYHMWKEDIEVMKQLGVRHYRTSISMSRILQKNGEPNRKALLWYTKYFKALKQAGITIYATLYHWELPQYLHEQGGWKNPKTIETFVRHAEVVTKELSEYIDEYFILNEPWCASLLSYHLGIHAPGEKNLASGLLASHHLLLAQGRAYAAIKNIHQDARVSTVFNVETSYAYSSDLKDLLAAKRADGYFNRWFLDPLFLGTYPSDMVELYGKSMPHTTKEEMKEIHIGNKLQTLGINYYCGRIQKWDDNAELGFSSFMYKDGPTNDLGWPICVPPKYPEGLYDILSQIWYSYREHGLSRIMITENGMALKAPNDDVRRTSYYLQHIGQVHKAILRGIPVRGYFAWTLMDNYEWAEGYRPESLFGMIHVDRETLKRSWKKSAHWYKTVLTTNSVESLKEET